MFHYTNHPQVNHVIEFFLEENQPFRKIHRLIDLSEVIIKTHTAYLISFYLQCESYDSEIKGLLVDALKTPSLGIWQNISRTLSEQLIVNHLSLDEWGQLTETLSNQEQAKLQSMYKQNGHYMELKWGKKRRDLPRNVVQRLLTIKERSYYNNSLYFKGFFSYFYEWDKTVEDVISLRNHYAHGATPSDHECTLHVNQYQETIQSWLNSPFIQTTMVTLRSRLHEHQVVIPEGLEADHPCLIINGHCLDLFPIIQYTRGEKHKEDSFYFFNDLKKSKSKKISYLNYPYAENIHDKEIYEKFIQYIDLENWKNSYSDEFKERIEDLSESFKGRKHEMERIHTWASNEKKGFLILVGPPGIGKSALMANIHLDSSKYVTITYFFSKGSTSQKFLDYINKQLEIQFKIRIQDTGTIEERMKTLFNRLWKISESLQEQKLVFLFDGLDELEISLPSLLFTRELSRILVVYSSRKTDKVSDFYDYLPVEYSTRMELAGLHKEDVRALLYEVVSKYELQHEYVEQIVEKSNGNPLYVKLLCDALFNKEMSLNDPNTLPKKLEGFYSSFLKRFAKEENGTVILSLIHVLAAAKDYLSVRQLEKITGYDMHKILQALGVLSEITVEKEDRFSKNYQLFHLSLRDYVWKKDYEYIQQTQKSLIEYCMKWNESDADDVLKAYAFNYLSRHLFEEKDLNTLLSLSENGFVDAQINFTNHYQSSFQFYQDATKLALEKKKHGDYIKLCVKTVQLHQHMSHSLDDILFMIEKGGVHSIELAISRISLLDREGKVLLFTYLLHLIVTDRIAELTEEDKDHLINMLEKAFDTFSLTWSNESIPIAMLFQLVQKLPSQFLHDLDVPSYKMMELISQQNLKDHNIILLLIKWIVGRDPRDQVLPYIALAKKCRETGIKEVSRYCIEKVIMLLDHKDVRDVVNIIAYESDLLSELIQHDFFSEARGLLETIDDSYTTVYSEMATRLCEESRLDEAFSLLHEVENTATQQIEWKSASIYEAIASHYLKEGSYKKALDYIRKMNHQEIRNRMLEKVLDTVLRKKEFQIADDILKEFPSVIWIVKLKEALREHRIECEDETQEMIESYILQEMKKVQMIHDTDEKYHAILHLAVELTYMDRWEEALAFIQEEVPYVLQKSRLLKELSLLAFQLKGFQAAKRIVDEIEYDEFVGTAYFQILEEYIKNGEVEQAMEVMSYIPLYSTPYRNGGNVQIIEYFIGQRELEKAYHYYSTVEKEVLQQTEDPGSFYESVAQALLKHRYLQEVVDMRKDLLSRFGYESFAVSRLGDLIAKEYYQNQSPDRVYHFLIEEMKEKLEVNTKTKFLNNRHFETYVKYLYQHQHKQEFVKIVQDKKAMNLLSFVEPKDRELVASLIDESIQEASSMKNPEMEAMFLLELVPLLMKFDYPVSQISGMLKKTFDIVVQLDQQGLSSNTDGIWRELIKVHLELGDEKSLLSMLKHRHFYTEQIQILLGIVGNKRYQNRKHKIELLDQAWELANKEDRKLSQVADTYTMFIICYYLDFEEFDKAFTILFEHQKWKLFKGGYGSMVGDLVLLLLKYDRMDDLETLFMYIDDPIAMAIKNIQLGSYYWIVGEYEMAYPLITEALKVGNDRELFEESFHLFFGYLSNDPPEGKKMANLLNMIPDVNVKVSCILKVADTFFDKNQTDGQAWIDHALVTIQQEMDEADQVDWMKDMFNFSLTESQMDFMLKIVQTMQLEKNMTEVLAFIYLKGSYSISRDSFRLAQEKLSYSSFKQFLSFLVGSLDVCELKKVEMLKEQIPHYLEHRELIQSYLSLVAFSDKIHQNNGYHENLKTIDQVVEIPFLLEEDNQDSMYSIENIDEWIDKISDPEVRLEIQIFAKAVQKGRFKREDFDRYLDGIRG